MATVETLGNKSPGWI